MMAEYIDRTGLLHLCDDMITKKWITQDPPASWAEAYEEFKGDIENVPIADVQEVKHGRWEKVDDFDGEYHWKCTSCDIEWWFECGGLSENGSHYCPTCGAKMNAEG